MFTSSIDYLSTLPSFLAYFGLAVGLLALFIAVYVRVTPYREFALIAEGNAAPALTLGGAVLGFVLPLGSVVIHSYNLVDMLIWGLIALAVQVATFLVANLCVRRALHQRIASGNVAAAALLGVLSLAVGILNAACMVY